MEWMEDVKTLISREVRAHCATVANEALLGRSGSTKYETRGRALGSEIRNFCYRYVGASLE